MTSSLTFSELAAQLREFIGRCSAPAGLFSEREMVPPLLGERASVVPDKQENEFNRLALSLFALQFSHNPPLRRFCDSRRISPETTEHWTQIPAVPAVAFKEFELTSLTAAQRVRVFHSSGTTTQHPGRHFHDAESLSLYEASLLPWFQTHLLPELSTGGEGSLSRRLVLPELPSESGSPAKAEGDGERSTSGQSAILLLSLTPPPELAPHSSLVHMFAAIHAKFGSPDSAFTGLVQADAAWDVDFDKSLYALQDAIAAKFPVIVMGTAFNFVQLADHLERAALRLALPAGFRILETGGYKGRTRSLSKASLLALISHSLGVLPWRIVSEYGMSELSSQAYDSKIELSNSNPSAHERTFHFPPWARAQIISPETGREVADGETGLIRVFDLANLRSVLAVQTEDLGVRRGDGFELLGRAALAEARGCSLMSA
jgi:Acyl-protein synthetase, LuxE